MCKYFVSQAVVAQPQQTNTNSFMDASFFSSLSSSSLTSVTASVNGPAARNQVLTRWSACCSLYFTFTYSAFCHFPHKVVWLSKNVLSSVLRSGQREGRVWHVPSRRRRPDSVPPVFGAFPCSLPLLKVRRPLNSYLKSFERNDSRGSNSRGWQKQILIPASLCTS